MDYRLVQGEIVPTDTHTTAAYRYRLADLRTPEQLARGLGLTPARVRQLRRADAFPLPVGMIGGRPVWHVCHVEAWAKRVGRPFDAA